jgi:4-amino-4-deoxy-L-arabinose transferase-like glycosyltransferase
MATRDFSKYFLYRWRYVIGYGTIGLLLAGLLVFAGLYLPGGISELEITSVVRSAAITLQDPATLTISNLPYYALQAAIFGIFGVSIFTIKLSSLILALLTAIGFIFLLRRWFKPNIAVLTALIAITTGQFLFIAQSGTPSILYVFWPVVLLLLGTQITRVNRFRFLWKALFALAAGLSLYTPLSVYSLLAIALAVVLHPHLRAVVRKLSKIRLSVVSAIFLVTIAPLVYLIISRPALGLTLLGVPADWPPNINDNALLLLQQYFLFWAPSVTYVLTPMFSLGSALLICLGLYRLIRTRDTTRSYLIILWLVCLVPVLLLNPAFTSVIFVPSMLLLAAGLTSLIDYWYRLFPLNPYARIAGLIPIAVLVSALIFTGVSRYVYSYHYAKEAVSLYSRDIRLLPTAAEQVVVSEDEEAFYNAVAQYRDITVVERPTADTFIASQQAKGEFTGYQVTEIITDTRSDNADRFYVYERAVEQQ